MRRWRIRAHIDEPLVDAYLARRALDYLVGFTLSPVLWRKLPGARSAGRVQSVALRLVCDREAEIEALHRAGILVDHCHADQPAPGSHSKRALPNSRAARSAAARCRQRSGSDRHQGRCWKARSSRVASVESKPAKRNPFAPFTTSTLQQDASRKLGFSAKRIMQVAQKLYEGIDIGGETVGLITYMRTDGVQIAPEAIDADPRRRSAKSFGDRYVPEKPRHLFDQGQERAGSARGDPPDRYQPHAEGDEGLSR